VFLEVSHHAGGGVEPVGASAGKQDGMDLLNQVGRSKKLDLASAGGGTANVNTAYHLGVAKDHGAARQADGIG